MTNNNFVIFFLQFLVYLLRFYIALFLDFAPPSVCLIGLHSVTFFINTYKKYFFVCALSFVLTLIHVYLYASSALFSPLSRIPFDQSLKFPSRFVVFLNGRVRFEKVSNFLSPNETNILTHYSNARRNK